MSITENNLKGGFPFLTKFFISLSILFIPLVQSNIFLDYSMGTKWLVIYAMGIFSLFFFWKVRSISIPKLDMISRVFIFLLGALYCLNLSIHFYSFISEATLGRLTFGILTIFFAIAFYQKYIKFDDLLFPVLVATFLFFLQIVVNVYIYGFHKINSFLPSSFGNINMAAQFVGISIFFQIYALTKYRKKRLFQILLTLGLAISLVFIFYAFSRSVYGGVAISLLFSLWLIPYKRARRWVLSAILLALLGIGIYEVGSYKDDIQKSKITVKKEGSTKQRLGIWKDTVALIKDKPLGVGVGYFEFAFIPYKTLEHGSPPLEDTIEKAPHSEMLRFLSEDGIIFTILGVLLLFRLAILFRRNFLGFLRDRKGCCVLSLFLFLIPEILVQFPLQTPFPFFIITIILGFCISRVLYANDAVEKVIVSNKFLSVVSFIYILIFLVYGFAKYVEKNYSDNYKVVSLACKVSPFDWRVCLLKGQIEFREERLTDSIKTANFELKKRKDNFVALELLAFSTYHQGKKEEGCRKIIEYDTIFKNRSSHHDFIKKNCRGVIF